MNVIDQVVQNDLCSGCGVCAGICPAGTLVMEWSDKGERVPSQVGGCRIACRVCLDVCPFTPHEIDKQPEPPVISVNHADAAEEHLSCYCGYSTRNGQREAGASGGMATWFLCRLLEAGIADRVALVGRGSSEGEMFTYRIAETVEQVQECAGSAYFPVEVSSVLKMMRDDDTDRRYAVMALPCVVQAIVLAMKSVPVLRQRISVLASLTCGQMQNRFYSEYIAVETGIALDSLKAIYYRRKSPGRVASDFAHVVVSRDGHEGKPAYYQDIPLHLWKYRYFTLNACNFCDDVFGELADVTFMDAWLPEYEHEWQGTSLVVARSNFATEILKEAMNSGESSLHAVDIEAVRKSQQGVIFRKTELLAARLYAADLQGMKRPRSRIIPSETLFRRYARWLDLTDDIRMQSKRLWPIYRLDADTRGFKAAMRPLERRIKRYEKADGVRSFLGHLLRWVLSR